MNLLLTIDRPVTVTVEYLTPLGLAVVSSRQGGTDVAGIVALSAVRPVGDYAWLCADQIARSIPVGATIRIQGTAASLGVAGAVPVADVPLGGGSTLDAYLIAQGWAVPRLEVLASHQHHDALVAALAQARAARAGIWGETGVTAESIGLPPDLAKRTTPAPETPLWAVLFGGVLLLAMITYAAMREQRWRTHEAQAGRGRVMRAGRFLLGLRPGLFRS